jgi:hypothetical protein
LGRRAGCGDEQKKISVRLDAPRHFRMKLVAFKMNWSAQS